MKKVMFAIVAMAVLGFAWTASAGPTYSDAERSYWENQSLRGN